MRFMIAAPLATVALGLGYLPHHAIARAAPSTDPAALAQSVTIQEEHLVLGELLAEVSKQTQVPLSVDSISEPHSGIHMTVSLKKQSLSAVMTAMEELFTHRFNSAEWIPDEKHPEGYLLRFARTPEMVGEAARSEAVERIRQDARLLHKALRLPAQVREGLAAGRPDLFRARLMNGPVGEIFASLREDELEMSLRGRSLILPVQRLSNTARTGIDLGFRNRDNADYAAIQSLQIGMEWNDGDMLPMLTVSNPLGIRLNLVGGPLTEQDWLLKNGDGWMHRGDKSLQQEYSRISREKKPMKAFQARNRAGWSMEWGKSFSRDFIGHWTSYDLRNRFSPNGAKRTEDADESLKLFTWMGALMTKKVNRIQLMRSQQILTGGDAGLVSWPTRRQLRRSALDNDGFLTLDDLGRIAEMNDLNRADLFDEFGSISGSFPEEWVIIHRFRNRLLPRWRARLESRSGLPLRDAGSNARLLLLAGVASDSAAAAQQKVRNLPLLRSLTNRLIVKLRIESGRVVERKPTRKLVWEIFHADRRDVPVHVAETSLDERKDPGARARLEARQSDLLYQESIQP